MVKFIHCADLHLDSPFKSRSKMIPGIFDVLTESTYISVKRMIDYAIKEKVDFLVIAGDMFDEANRTLKSEVFMKRQFERLKEAGIFAYIIHGNHDPLTDGFKAEWPDNVTVFSENVETYEMVSSHGERVFLHGFSYFLDDTYENRLEEYPVNTMNEGIHIGLLHGTYSQSQSTQKRYTEFNLQMLNEKLYHYWALGHIHQREELSDLPPVHYSGNIQGRHKNEYGEKGFLVVEGDDVYLTTRFIPVQEIIFAEYELEVGDLGKQSLYQTIAEFKHRLRDKGKHIIQLTIIYDGDEELTGADLTEIIELLKEDERDIKQFVWIDDLKVRYLHQDNIALINDIKASHSSDEALFKEAVNSLYMDPRLNRYLEPVQDIVPESLLEEGEERLRMLMRK